MIKVSRHIEGNLDRDVEDYQLTAILQVLIPFKVKEQYQKNIGREVKIKTINGDRYRGN